MLRLTNHSAALQVRAAHYILTWCTDRPYVYLDDASGTRLAELFVFSGVHAVHGRDDTTAAGPWEVVLDSPYEIRLEARAASSVWAAKTYRFRCLAERFIYEVEVEGRGRLCEVDYFGGYYSAQTRWGSGFFWSGQEFRRGFTPEPNTAEQNYFAPGGGASIDLMGVPLPGRAGWFFTPPPFCFAFEGGRGWLGLGVEAAAGENHFTEYRYHGQGGGFFLSLAYEGHRQVNGRYRLPGIGFDFAAGEYEALAAHVAGLQAAGHVPAVSAPTSASAARPQPAWWQEPIFCGWGAQCYQAAREGGKGPDYSRQWLYEGFLATLEKHAISPGIVVLDDKWQATYGDNQADPSRWPDLPGYVAGQHARGRKVLLWLKAWDPEGIPVEECITNAHSTPLAVDPTHPAYEARLRAGVRRMLSAEGYNADGFKIDFTARIPSGPGICTHGELWGLELMKRYLAIIYTEAKAVKPDALVMTHTPHPYLADVLDMVRLNDINMHTDVNAAMRRRWQVARTACPNAIIDTDNWPITDRAAWRCYLRLQPELGVPSLYFASHIDSTQEPLTGRDYRLIREVWAAHRAKHNLAPPEAEPGRPLFTLPLFALPALRQKEGIG